MTPEELETHVQRLGHSTDRETVGNASYLLIRSIQIPSGLLAGRVCDVAIQLLPDTSFVMPAAIHVRPPLLPMQGGEPFGTQASPLGEDWQYWSRRYDGTTTPANIWAHVLGILTEDRLVVPQ